MEADKNIRLRLSAFLCLVLATICQLGTLWSDIVTFCKPCILKRSLYWEHSTWVWFYNFCIILHTACSQILTYINLSWKMCCCKFTHSWVKIFQSKNWVNGEKMTNIRWVCISSFCANASLLAGRQEAQHCDYEIWKRTHGATVNWVRKLDLI